MTKIDAPIKDFAECHEGIFKQLEQLGALPGLVKPAIQAQQTAERVLEFFQSAVFEHHLDEERELFPAVIAAANQGEAAEVTGLTTRLIADHRELEALWKQVEPGLKRVTKGHFEDLDVGAIERLVRQYQHHARHEESAFLPLAEAILGRTSEKMADLGRSLHLRHKGLPIQPFF